jgi:two-component system, OmpR family, response regulator
MSRAMAPGSFESAATTGQLMRRILVVDDDRSSREGLTAALRGEGHAVETAADAWQAIVRLRAQSFDVAIVDLDLPAVHGVELGGWDVVRIARAYRPTIGVIVLTADEDPTPGHEALALEVAGILGKPISLQELTGLVDTVRLPASSRAPALLNDV